MNRWQLYTTNEISPSGWLLRQLEIQAEGLSGHLHKIWPDIRDSKWVGGKREGWERVPYWLDGFVPLAFLLKNDEMIADAKKYIDAIIAQQQADGWICPCKDARRSTYDTWALQLICKTLTVYYECSGDERIPGVIYRAMHNYYILLKTGKIKLFGWAKYRWFEAFIALNFLYAKYNEEWIRALAKILKQQGFDYNTAVKFWKTRTHAWTFHTHIVNLTMQLKSEAVSHELLGETYTDNAEKLRAALDQYNGTAFEGFTGDEVLSGIDPSRGTELCSVVEQMYSYELLFAVTGDSKWAQRLEVLAFNALPATMSEDMWTHQYVQMVNQIACQRTMPMAPFSTNKSDAHLFGLEPNFGCCTANFNQGWPKLALSSFMHKDNTIINALMIPSVLTDNGITIRLETEYPFKNKMHYTIEADKEFEFIIRIPSFAENLQVNGEAAATKDLTFDIARGKTEITVEFATTPYLKARPHGLSTLQMGSLLFSVPIAYEKQMHEYTRFGVERKFPYCDYQFIPKSEWSYGFADDAFEVQHNEIGEYPFSQAEPPVTIKANLQKIEWGLKTPYKTVCRSTPKSTKPVSQATQIALQPYGCSRLRMTEMPVLGKK